MSSENNDDTRTPCAKTTATNKNSNGYDDSITVLSEEEPTMRAVALMGPPSIGLQDTFGGIQRPSGGFGAPPPLRISRPEKSLKRDVRCGRGEGKVAKEWTAKVAVPSEWNVDSLEIVPDDFPLERTSKEIVGADGTEVATRISDALRDMSIQAKFDGKGAKAKCRTTDYISFRIRLFAAVESSKQPVIVEVQRRSGSCSSFMRVYRAILKAAEGEQNVDVVEKKSPPTMKKPIGEMACLKEVVDKSKCNRDEDARSGLDCAMNLLRKDEKDSIILGLENMCHLTDPQKTDPLVSLHVSKSVIIGDQSNNAREVVALHLRDSPVEPEEDDAIDLDAQLHSLALNTFSNSLALTSKDGCLADAVKLQEWYSEFLIPALMRDVKNFEASVNDSYTASCCLKSLMISSPVALERVQELEGEKALADAIQYGSRLHDMLANEAKLCVNLLQTSP